MGRVSGGLPGDGWGMREMKIMNVRIRVVSLAVLMGLSLPVLAQTILTKPEDVGLSSAKLALIHDALKIQIDAGQIPGAIVLVARDGKVVHFEAQGVTNVGSVEPLQTGNILGAGSLTKAVVSVAAMMLVEDGKLNLDDPVSKYIPEFGAPRQVRVLKPGSPPAPYSAMPGAAAAAAMAAGKPPVAPPNQWGEPQYEMVPAVRPITVRMLLTHTSGVQIFGIDNAFPLHGPTETLASFVPKLASVPLEFQPGSRWGYSNNIGFEIIARIIEVASGMNLRQFLQQRLFGPLGMNDTDIGVKRASAARAVPYAPGLGVTIAEEVTYFNGSAGLWTTVGDYSLFARMLANNGSFNGREYLKSETVKQMASNQIGPFVIGGYPLWGMSVEGLKFGFGFLNVALPEVEGTRLPAGSFGWNGDGTRLFWVVPEERIAIVSMMPTIGPQAAPLQRTIEAIVMTSIIRP
jgi:CubicO group peptidase (beta-lactamase class C family)